MLQIDKFSLKKPATLATTYMNISAILSNMGRYPESYKLAKKANVMFLQIKEEQMSKLAQESELDTVPEELEESVKINFIISYFNMAIAAECTGKKKLALEHAGQGYHFALVDIAPNHPLTENLKQYLDKITDDIAQGQLLRPQPKPKKEDPSSRQHDTSYFSDKLSEPGLNDVTAGSSRRSQRDRSMYNPEGRPLSFRKKHRYRPRRQTLSQVPKIQRRDRDRSG